MKRKIWQLTFLSLLIFCSASIFSSSSPATIDKILVEPGKLSTKIILEADAAAPFIRAFYAKESPKTLVLELSGIVLAQAPQVQSADPNFLVSIDLEKLGSDTSRLLLKLREQVPYRVYADRTKTIVELNKIQRGGGEYVVAADVQRDLETRPGETIFMDKLNVEENDALLRFRARLSSGALSQVFALEEPLRLVVDIFNAIYEEPASVLAVEKYGLKRARVAQFQLGNPRSITRMVFDLERPQQYSLNVGNDEIVVGFFKDTLSLPAVAAKTAPENPSLPSPEVTMAPPKASQPPPQAAKSVSVPNGPRKAANNKPAQETEFTQEQAQEEKYKPRTIAEAEVKYTGEIITLKFKDADLRDVILYLGDFAKLNVVFDPEVRGVVTCNLEDVPWDQALDILLRNNKLGKVLEGNVLRIAPISVLTREDEEQRRLRESRELAGPLIVKTITLSYSKARDVMSLLNQKKSERGQITIDERTNTLIISDVKESLDLLEKLIAVLDTPTPQVSIEARIVEATSTFIRNLGIQWGFRGVADPFYGNQTSLEFPNKMLVDGSMIPQGIVTKGIGGPLGGYAINLPAPAFTTALGFSFANILDTFRLDMAITALETSGQGRIISCPKVTTQNNQAAEIIQGRQIPVQTVANFTVTTRYVNAALELKATPQITAEGTIIMTLEIQNNAADFANLVSGIPPITTQSAKTTVMVPDGGTTVIGGIYRTEDSITRERVPFLHSIPILGNLFRSFARTKQNRELLIFITPRIIK
ncbi:MAG: type IV pilus secretin PilQ [Clostridiales bacterium]|nr:type IV pilus secretin PilQ [Clostridiales bacterium]